MGDLIQFDRSRVRRRLPVGSRRVKWQRNDGFDAWLEAQPHISRWTRADLSVALHGDAQQRAVMDVVERCAGLTSAIKLDGYIAAEVARRFVNLPARKRLRILVASHRNQANRLGRAGIYGPTVDFVKVRDRFYIDLIEPLGVRPQHDVEDARHAVLDVVAEILLAQIRHWVRTHPTEANTGLARGGTSR